MATYTINTTRTQEIGLSWSYDTYADKTQFPTKEAYFQNYINRAVTNPMYDTYVRDHAVALDLSVATIPEAERPAAQAEIEETITSHGGTIVPAGPPKPPTPPTGGM